MPPASKPPAQGKGKGKGKGGKPQGHWITIHGHDGRPHHVFIAGPRPRGLGHGKHASLAAAKGALTRGVNAQNAQAPKPVSPGATAAEGAQGRLAGRATKASRSLSALRGKVTKGTKATNAAPRPAPDPAPRPKAPLATGRGTAARSGQAAAIREGMAASKAGAPGSVPYREARRNYLDALKPGLVKRPAAPAPKPKPAPAPTHPSSAPKVQPIVPRGTSERRAVAGQIRTARRDPDREGLGEARTAASKIHTREISAAPVHEHVVRRVEQAFAKADTGSNFVRLRDLRSHLADLPRPHVDAAIRHLQKEGKFSLDVHEGLNGRPLTRSERRAGLPGLSRKKGEAPHPLVYIARRK